jgi:hypothetical protein
MGSGVAGQCSRNRCLARWTAQIPHRGRGGEAGQATRRKTWSRARSEVFVPYTIPRTMSLLAASRPIRPRRIALSAFMLAVGMVNDHIASCFRWAALIGSSRNRTL